MADMNNAKERFPTDYEPCSVCSYDHAYDVPLLNADEYTRVLHLHLADHPIPPYDLIVASATRLPAWRNER